MVTSGGLSSSTAVSALVSQPATRREISISPSVQFLPSQ
jgi:hypothetical protein